MYIILLQLELFSTFFFFGWSSFSCLGSTHVWDGQSSYVSFQTVILKQEQLLSENSQNTHWIVIFSQSEGVHFTPHGLNPKVHWSLGAFDNFDGFHIWSLWRKKTQNQKTHGATLHHLAASLCVGIQLTSRKLETSWDFSLCFVPHHLCIWKECLLALEWFSGEIPTQLSPSGISERTASDGS